MLLKLMLPLPLLLPGAAQLLLAQLFPAQVAAATAGARVDCELHPSVASAAAAV
jgi:hypothetical protein